MKQVICYKCNEMSTALYGMSRTITHGRGRCTICSRIKLGIILEKTDNKKQAEQKAFVCPHCGEEIEYLRYSTNGYEYGSESIETGDMDSDGFESTDETEYACPECDNEISSEDIEKYRDAQTKENDNRSTAFKGQRPLTE